ncbi:MAG TPA: mannosyltransferase family protein [Candidatus Binatia bacterium]|nr:mannosyltransferase family protein [Candidatus Binatia bacterium]
MQPLLSKARLLSIELRKKLLKSDGLLAVSCAVSLIAVAIFISWYNNKVVPLNADPTARYTLEPNNFLKFMSNWDGPNYIELAKHGYTNIVQANFFPLYPLVIRLLRVVIGSPLVSALLVSWLSLIGSLYFYLKIIKHVFKLKVNAEALRCLIFFILFPTAIFLLATYTEGLLTFLALAAIYCGLKKHYLPAAVLVMLATATHITGLLVLVLVALILLEEGVKRSRVILGAAIGSLGLISYMYFLWRRFDRPLAFITSQEDHGWLRPGFSRLASTIDLFNVVFIILLILTVIYWWNRRKSFAIYAFLFLMIPLIGRQFGGFNRYVLIAFPVQLMLYSYLRNKKLAYTFIIAFMAIIWTYFTLQYAGGYVGG